MAASSTNNLKLAEKGVWVSIIAYIVLSIGQIAFAAIVHSSALQANGFNNVTDYGKYCNFDWSSTCSNSSR